MNGEIAVGISAAAALAGTWLGSSLTSRHEDRRWERQERLNAYSAFLGAADQWRRAATDVWAWSDRTLPTYLNLVSEFHAKWAVVDLAADRVQLIGSDAIQDVTADLMIYLTNEIMTLTLEEPRVPEAKLAEAVTTGYVTHLRAFRDAARRDLTHGKRGFIENVWDKALAWVRSLRRPAR
jgi:hypothetical protein